MGGKQFRFEQDSLGDVAIDTDRYWGINTQRSLQHFSIGNDHFDWPFYQIMITLKKAAATSNWQLQQLPDDCYHSIVESCDQMLADAHWYQQFPLYVWQTGSGTQTNMNVNEVIANLANEKLGHPKGSYRRVHPNDHVNKGQSSNDVFPTAMHLSVAQRLQQQLAPALETLSNSLLRKVNSFDGIKIVGRTHLMDAIPMNLADSFSGYLHQLQDCQRQLEQQMNDLCRIALGGTAVGNGANTVAGFAESTAQWLAHELGLPVSSHPNKFAALSAEDDLLRISGSLKVLASALYKLASDIRLLASGPRCGIGELQIPGNEAGSSIMPGKTNPTQCEALTMVAIQVIANDQAISIANSQGQLQLNTYRPLILHNCCHSIAILSDSIANFSQYCLDGLDINEQRLAQHLEQNIMSITLISPDIGYEKASEIAHHAYHENCSLAEAAEALDLFDQETFKQLMQKKL